MTRWIIWIVIGCAAGYLTVFAWWLALFAEWPGDKL